MPGLAHGLKQARAKPPFMSRCKSKPTDRGTPGLRRKAWVRYPGRSSRGAVLSAGRACKVSPQPPRQGGPYPVAIRGIYAILEFKIMSRVNPSAEDIIATLRANEAVLRHHGIIHASLFGCAPAATIGRIATSTF